jgi:predicted RNA-binding protein with PUA-like domain
MSKRYWLMKSEPESYGWERLVEDGGTVWDGVRNHRAKLNLQAMKAGEQAFFYHSVTGKEIVGIVEIVRAGMADPKDETGTWAAVEIKPVARLERPVTLAEIKADPALKDIELIRQSRLSVAEIRGKEWERILAMAKA